MEIRRRACLNIHIAAVGRLELKRARLPWQLGFHGNLRLGPRLSHANTEYRRCSKSAW